MIPADILTEPGWLGVVLYGILVTIVTGYLVLLEWRRRHL